MRSVPALVAHGYDLRQGVLDLQIILVAIESLTVINWNPKLMELNESGLFFGV